MKIKIPYMCKEEHSVQISGNWRTLTDNLDPKSGVMVSIEIFKTDHFLFNSHN